MKFISTKAVKGKKIEVESNLDTDLIQKVKAEDEFGVYSIAYDVTEIGNPANFPFSVSGAELFARLTSEDVYVGAIVEFGDDDSYLKFDNYSEDGAVSFNLQLSNNEKIRLLSAIANKIAYKN